MTVWILPVLSKCLVQFPRGEDPDASSMQRSLEWWDSASTNHPRVSGSAGPAIAGRTDVDSHTGSIF